MAVRTITTRLALDGETQFKQAMAGVNSALRTVKSEIALSEATFKGQANTLDALTAKNKLLTDAIDQQKEKIKQLAQAVVDSAAAYGEDSTTTDKYKQQLNRAQAELIEMNRALQDNKKYLKEAQASADGTAKSIDGFGNSVKQSGDAVTTLANVLQAAGVAMAVKEIAGSIRECVDASKDFESAVAGYNKVAKLSSEELADMKEQFKELSTQIPATTSEIAQVAEAGTRLGISKENILEFTRVMIDLGNVSDMSADQAATALARFVNVLGTSKSDFDRLGSTIVALGNNFATSESEITEMSSRLASAGALARLTEPQIMALGAAMSSVGIQAEAGGTAMTQTLTAMEKAVVSGGKELEQFARIAGMSSSQFAQAWQNDPITAITAFIGGLADLDKAGESATLALDELGLSGIRQSNMLKSLALAYPTLVNALETANTAWSENSELSATAAERYGTTEAKMQMAANAANNLKIAIGDALTPTLGAAAEGGAAFLAFVAEAVDEFPILAQTAAGLTSGLGALTLGMTAMSAASALGVTSIGALSAAVMASPVAPLAASIGLVVTGLTALAHAADDVNEKLPEITQAMKDNRAAWEEQKDAVNAQRAEIENLADQLEKLAGKETRTAGEKSQLLAVTQALNEAVPGLRLSYDELNDTLSMTTEQVLALARAEADAQERADLAAKVVEAERNQAAAVRELEQAERDLATAQENLSKGIQNGLGVLDQAEYEQLSSEVLKARTVVEELTATVADGQAQVEKMSARLEEVAKASEAAAIGMGESADAVDKANGLVGELTTSMEVLEESTLYAAGAADALSAALKEQEDSGSLSLETTKELIEAGYGAAIAIDEETGAVTLNREEYIRLASAKIQAQMATLEAEKASLEAARAAAMEEAALRADSSAYWDAAKAKAAMTNTDDIQAVELQIAALNRAQAALASYGRVASTTASRSVSASKAIKNQAEAVKTQAEQDLEAYKQLKAELDYRKALDLASDTDYYRELAALRDQYLADETNISEYRKVTEQIYKYDRALADSEARLWANQTEALVRELEERVKSVTDQQDKMENRLSGYGDLFEVKDNTMTLNSIQAQIDAIDAYEQALRELRERGISEGLLDEVLGMDVDSATRYADQLLRMSEDQWEQYNDLWEEKQRRAAEVAEQFFREQMDALGNEYNDKLDAALDNLVETAFSSGEDTGQGLIDGLASMEAALYEQARNIRDNLDSILSGSVLSSSQLAAALSTERISERYQGVTGRQLNAAVIGGVNALSTANDNAGAQPMHFTIQTRDGLEIARAFIPDFRKAAAESPVVQDDE